MTTRQHRLPPSQTFPQALGAEDVELAPLQLRSRIDGADTLRRPPVVARHAREISPTPLTRRTRTEGAPGISFAPTTPNTPKPRLRNPAHRRKKSQNLSPRTRTRPPSPGNTVVPDDSISQVAEYGKRGKRGSHRKTSSVATSLHSQAQKHPNDPLRFHPSMLHDEYHATVYNMRRFGLKPHALPDSPIDEGDTGYDKAMGVYGATAAANESDVGSFRIGDFIMDDESPLNVLGRKAPRFEWFKAKGQRCMKPYGAVVHMAGLAGKLDVVEKYGESVMESDLEDVPIGWDAMLDGLGEVWIDDKGVGQLTVVIREEVDGLQYVVEPDWYDL
jgi:hypothetical protein